MALLAFDAGVYAASTRGVTQSTERVAEPVMAVGTAAALFMVVLLGGQGGGVIAVTTLWVRAGWDAMHLGDGNVLSIPLPRDYALFSLIAKAVASALFLLFAFPA